MTRGEKVIAFIEAYCKTPEGAKVGSSLKLADFQREFITDIYDNPHGTRRAILGIARKNGKSALIAALMLAHICGPEAKLNTQIVSGAQSRDQASLVLNSLLKQELTHSVLKLTQLPMFTRRIINWCPVKRLVVRPNLHMVRTGKLLGPRQKFLSMREVGLPWQV